MGQFQEAIDIFGSILQQQPSELRVLLSLGQSHLEFGRAQLSAGYTARAEASFVSSIQVTFHSMDATPGFRRIAWKIVADSLYALSRFSAFAVPDDVLSVIDSIPPFVSEHPQESVSSIISFPLTLRDVSPDAISYFALEAAIAAYSYRLSLGSLNDTAHASGYYDLGMALCALSRCSPRSTVPEAAQKQAISFLKEALKLDPLNDRYWNTLGNSLFLEQPKTAQHAYIRALEIDSKVRDDLLRIYYSAYSATERLYLDKLGVPLPLSLGCRTCQ